MQQDQSYRVMGGVAAVGPVSMNYDCDWSPLQECYYASRESYYVPYYAAVFVVHGIQAIHIEGKPNKMHQGLFHVIASFYQAKHCLVHPYVWQ